MPKAIKPFIEEPRNPLRVLLYPYRIYVLDNKVKKLAGEPLRLRLLVQVDRVRGKGFLVDSIPETVDVGGEEIKPIVSEDRAYSIAKRTALYYIMKKYRIGIAPEITATESIDIYKIFWVLEDGGRHYIVDSVTGDAEPL